ncbi:hypothetical protein MPER_12331 [Moniliophthora perniciosa FA553]|nr:hypothetical protein MPER_12331 [Moniliophthora perniciosa FA553]
MPICGDCVHHASEEICLGDQSKMDGNLHHKHQVSGGNGVGFHSSTQVLDKETVDAVGNRIDKARKRPPKTRKAKVPDEAVDACQHSYQAAQGDDKAASLKIFDENGLMALVCRHDIPIFFASIDTPGEQQKYLVALLERLYSMIPKHATVLALYDIACVVDRSKEMSLLPPALPLQQVLCIRMGISGSARWSTAHDYEKVLAYPMVRAQSVFGHVSVELYPLSERKARRIWLIDRQADAIALEHRAELGEWIFWCLYKNVQKKEAEADATLDKSGHSRLYLERQWGLQQIAQTSQRAYAPSWLKKELTKVLQLQTEIDSVEVSLEATEKAVKGSTHKTKESMKIIQSLTKTHEKLKAKAEKLYSSLRIPNQFPDLRKISFEYLHTLLRARDVKIEVRPRAIGNFLEWERLDSPTRGIHNTIAQQRSLGKNSI